MKRFQLLFAPALVLALLLPAGLRAQPAHNFDRWEKEISAYEAIDRTNPPPKGALLFVGSSTIRLWKTLAQDFPDQKVINRGFGGSEIVDSTHFADRLIFPLEPRMILFRAGGNDLANGKSPEQVYEDFKEFVACVQAKLPGAEIVYISWNPTLARWQQAGKEKALNDMVKKFVGQNPRLKYIETYDMTLGADGKPRAELFVADKLHFNSEGYKLLAERVRSFLKEEK